MDAFGLVIIGFIALFLYKGDECTASVSTKIMILGVAVVTACLVIVLA